jgi:ABC-type sugar transport system permease subunit/ABC-type glycerol-3-phosphate transport system substrate-binding protein
VKGRLIRQSLAPPALAAALLTLSAFASAEITLRFTCWDGDEAQAILRHEARAFERAHPGVKVQVEAVFYNDYFTKLLAQYAAGVAPDVAMLDPGNFQKFATRGALTPLNDLFRYVPGFDIGEYYEPIVEAHSWQGKLYVLPRDIAPMGLVYYNKKAFDEAGIPYPDGSWTWDFQVRPELREKDFLWVLQKLTKKDSRGKPIRYALTTWDPMGVIDVFVYSQGARYVDDPESPTRIQFTDPRIVRAHELLAHIYTKEKWIPSPSDLGSIVQSTADQLFSSQRSAMYVCGIWDAVKINRIVKPGTRHYFEWDIAMMPAFRDGTRAGPTGGSGYAVMSSTKHPKEAFQLAAWMAGKPGMLAMARAGFAQPAIRSLALSREWLPDANTPPESRNPQNRIITDKWVPFVVFAPNASSYPELYQFLQAKRDSIWNGQLTAKDGLAQAQELAQNRLNDIRKEERLPKLNWLGAGLFMLGLVAALVAWIYLPERRRKLLPKERYENRIGYLFLSPWILGMVLFTLGPMLICLVMSFTDWDTIQDARWRGLGNYSEAFGKDPRFWKSLLVTGAYTLFSVPLGIVIALALALLLNVKVRGIALFRTCFYLPALASTVAASLVMRKVFQQDGGLLNSAIYGPSGEGNLLGMGTMLSGVTGSPDMANWLGHESLALPSFVLMSFWAVGASMVILLAGLQGIPNVYYEAALLDGAGPWQRFKAVTFPLLTPALFFVLITSVIGSFQVFTQVFVITLGGGGPNDSTRVFMLHLYDNAFKNLRMGYASALAWVLFVVILVFTLLQFQLNKKVYYEGEAN